MNVYRNKITGAIVEIASEFGSDEVWEKISPSPVAPKKVKAEPEEVAKEEAPKKKTTTRKAVKK